MRLRAAILSAIADARSNDVLDDAMLQEPGNAFTHYYALARANTENDRRRGAGCRTWRTPVAIACVPVATPRRAPLPLHPNHARIDT
ncbi:MAG TPA: hypothetical protein VFT96_12015 [Gemmatimonadaceae bacterium]|nr:hypothetical protein [Gemmatimonadaceae bacterium]